jgi:hypothetical protein
VNVARSAPLRRLLLFATLVASVNVVHAQRILPLDTVSRDAGAVVIAKVLDVQMRREGNIYTFVNFQTLQTIKGSVAPRFTYRMLGGRVDDVEVSSDPPNPNFRSGMEVVLFLGRQSSVDGYPTLYMDNVYIVSTAPNGARSVSRMDPEQPEGWRGPVTPLTDFLAAVRRAL